MTPMCFIDRDHYAKVNIFLVYDDLNSSQFHTKTNISVCELNAQQSDKIC